MSKLIDLTGKVFGRLTVISRNGSDSHKNAKWLCQCTCGSKKAITSGSLRNKRTQSCGCFFKDMMRQLNTTHGKSHTREFCIWSGIKERCLNQNNKSWPRYGGRGIKIYKLWLDDFKNFLNDMGKCPENYSIERIDNDGDYEPSNCMWIPKKFQMRNRSITKWFYYKNEKLCYAEVSRKLNIPRHKLRYLIEDKKLSLDDAIIFMKEDKYRKLSWDINKAHQMKKDGFSYTAISREMGVTESAIFYAFKRHNLS